MSQPAGSDTATVTWLCRPAVRGLPPRRQAQPNKITKGSSFHNLSRLGFKLDTRVRAGRLHAQMSALDQEDSIFAKMPVVQECCHWQNPRRRADH